MQELIDVRSRPPLKEPILIVGFGVRRRGGRSASRALQRIADSWKSELVARIDCEDFIDLTDRRPNIDTSDWRLEWPDTNIYLASPAGSKHDLLLLVGFEPNFHWSRYADSIATYADSLGVKTLVTVRSFPGEVPHTRPTPILISSSDIELELQFGVQARGSRYQGPTDVAGVLAARVQDLRWRWADLTALQPHYFPRMPNHQLTLTLMRVLDHALGSSTRTTSVQEDARRQIRAIDDSIAGSTESRSAVEELESRYDAGAERMDFLTPPSEESANLPSGEEIVEEIERLFREGGKLD
ncbi:MAG TPA: PAC2 family protein [Dehalococcoidia bacterium]|nr:PAC2 family protein [Dehalococcoidia bacterium]